MPITAGQPLAPAAGSTQVARTPWAALSAIVLLAAALRFATLTTQSVWFDEAATWELMRLSFGDMLSHVAHHESSPPLFYLVEWCWTHIFGTREAGLRSLSALAGTLTVPVAYGIGARLVGRRASASVRAGSRSVTVASLTRAQRAGLATAALVAVNPLLVWFSQESRAYALVVLLSAASLLLFVRCLDDERPRLLAAWAAVSALALATHYFAAFVLVPQAAWLLWCHPRRRAPLAAVGALVLAAAALLPLVLSQRGNPYDIAGSSIALRLVQVPKQFLLGYHGPLPLVLGLAGAALVAGGAWLLARRTAPTTRTRALGFAAIGAIGIALPVAAAAVGADYLNARNALPALVPLVAALGVAYGASRPSRPGAAMLGGLCAISLAIVVAVAAEQRYQRSDWAGLAHALGTADEPRAIVIAPANGEAPLRFYRHGLATMRPDGVAVREVDVVGVAGATSPGGAQRLPPQNGTALGVGGFGAVRRIRTPSYEILRFRASVPMRVTPTQLAALRFSAGFPSVAVLAPGG